MKFKKINLKIKKIKSSFNKIFKSNIFRQKKKFILKIRLKPQ